MPKSHCETHWRNGKSHRSPEYTSWQGMRARVYNPNCPCFARYGGRGITVDPRWNKFENFLDDMGRKPTPKHTLERNDNDKGYSKENCSWATRQAQARNRGTFHTITTALAETIRTTYVRGVTRQVDIAAQFGLRQADVSQIVRGVRWNAM